MLSETRMIEIANLLAEWDEENKEGYKLSFLFKSCFSLQFDMWRHRIAEEKGIPYQELTDYYHETVRRNREKPDMPSYANSQLILLV